MFKAEVVKQRIYEITGVRLRGTAYVTQAFTRSSYSGCENCEIFEMYGDSILSYYSMIIVHERYGFFRSDFNYNYKGETGYALRGIRNESALHELKKKMVCNETLAKQIDKWDLAKYLILGKADELNHVREQEKVKADLFESILGAIAVTCNFDSEILLNVVKRMLPLEEIFKETEASVFIPVQFDIENAVTVLKELSEKGEFSVPEYEYMDSKALGYFPNGDPKWSCLCKITNIGFSKIVFSNSKKTAKKCVSYMALCSCYEKTDAIAQYNANASSGVNAIIEKDGAYEIVNVPFASTV